MFIPVLLLVTFAAGSEFSLESEVSIELASPASSAAWSRQISVLAWMDADSAKYCSLQRDKCEGRHLATGNEVAAFGCQNCEVATVAVATDSSIEVFDIGPAGVGTMVIKAERPRELAGVYFDESRFLLVWSGLSRTGDHDIFGCVFANSMEQDCGFLINSFAQGDQRRPSVYASNSEALVAWESDGYRFGVFAQRLNALGGKVRTELAVADGCEYSRPVVLSLASMLLRRSVGVSPVAETCIAVESSGSFSIETLTGVDDGQRSVGELAGKVVGTDMYILANSANYEGVGHIDVLKTNTNGCLLSKYTTVKLPLDSHKGGKLLSVTATTLTLMYYDQVKGVSVVRTLKSPDNSMCIVVEGLLFPEWKTPAPSRPESWRKIVIISACCFCVVLLTSSALVLVRAALRRRHARLSLPALDISQDQSSMMIKGDVSLAISEPQEMSSPGSPEKLIQDTPVTPEL